MNKPNDPLWRTPPSFLDPPTFERDDHDIYPPAEPFRPHWLAWGVLAILVALVGFVVGVVLRG